VEEESSDDNNGWKIGVGVGVGVGGCLLLVIIAFIVICCLYSRRSAPPSEIDMNKVAVVAPQPQHPGMPYYSEAAYAVPPPTPLYGMQYP
jgi:hypothetical protein